MVTVFNNTKERHVLELSVVDDERTVVRQYIELPAGRPNYSPEVQTVVSLGRVASGKRVNVRASVDGNRASVNDVPLVLDCVRENGGNAVTARVRAHGDIYLTNDLSANHCFSETETASDSGWLDS